MSEPLHDIDKLFHDSIEGHTEYPPKKVWEKIEAGLDKSTAVTYRRKYKILKRAAAVLLFLLFSVVVYEIVNRNSNNSRLAGTEQNNENDKKKIKETTPGNGTGEMDNTDKKDPQQAGLNNDTLYQGTNSPDNEFPPISTGKNIESNNNDLGSPKSDFSNNDKLSGQHYFHTRSVKDESLTINSVIPNKRKNSDLKNNLQNQIISSLTSNDPDNITEHLYRPAGLILLNTVKKNVKDVPMPIANANTGGAASILKQSSYPKAKRSTNPFKTNRGFSVLAYFLPSTAWNELEDDRPHQFSGGGGPGGPVQNHNEIKKNETRSIAYSAGIKLSYGLNRRFSIRAGLNYTKSTTAERSKEVYAEKDDNGHIRYRSDCSSGYTYLLPAGSSSPVMGDRKIVSNIRNTLSYLGVPVEVEYRITSGKFSLSASTGTQVNILLKGKTNAVFEKGTNSEKAASNTTEGLKPSYFSALAGITGELHLSNKLSLVITPTGQFGLSSINQGTSVKTKPNYIGLSGGLKLKL